MFFGGRYGADMKSAMDIKLTSSVMAIGSMKFIPALEQPNNK
jgi:hypothetical protein